MSDWMDWLGEFSGAASGVVSGLTAGAKPFDAWEGVRTKDIANDRGELTNRDLELMQWAREMDGDYYGNKVGAEDSGYRKKMAGDEYDIFAKGQQLGLTEYLADPNGAFQQGLRETGWEPGSPEYRQWLAEAMSMYDPTGAVAAYDKMGVPGIENRNLNEQAALRFIESYAQQKDPNARVVRNSDGTVSIVSNGEETPVSGDVLVKVAAMINAKTPYDAISGGIKDETNIQNSNINLVKALRDGSLTPAAASKLISEQGVRLNQAYTGARNELAALTRDPMFATLSPDEQEARTAPLRARIQSIQSQMDTNQAMLNRVVTNTALPRVTGQAPAPRVGPVGGTSVTTRPAPGSIAARAAGVAPAPWGTSSQGPGYPTRRVSPQDTGVRRISQDNTGMPDELLAFLQLIGAA